MDPHRRGVARWNPSRHLPPQRLEISHAPIQTLPLQR